MDMAPAEPLPQPLVHLQPLHAQLSPHVQDLPLVQPQLEPAAAEAQAHDFDSPHDVFGVEPDAQQELAGVERSPLAQQDVLGALLPPQQEAFWSFIVHPSVSGLSGQASPA